MNVKKILIKAVENWPAKVLSVALALVLFVFNRMNTLAMRPLSVPLNIETSTGLIPASTYPPNIRVNLRGEDAGIKSILDNDIEAYVDLTRHETEGWYRAPVQVRKKASALNVEPLEITVNPIEISVQLDRRTSKTLPLAAVLRGKTAAGFDLVSHTTVPAEIVVSGPADAMESLTGLQTEPVDLDGRNSDFRVMVNIVRPNEFFVFRDGGMAEFRGQVRQSVAVRNFDGIPIVVRGLNVLFTVDLGGRSGSVRLEGNPGRLDAFEPPAGFLSIDCSGLAPGRHLLSVNVDIPPGFSLIRREPEILNITITAIEPPEHFTEQSE